MLVPLALAAACAATAGRVAPQEAPQEAAALESRVRTVALFKNGFAFVRREAVAPAGARSVRMDQLPVPVHGTFWIAGDPAQVKVGSATARTDRLVERSPALTVEEILRANVGRSMTLFLSDKESISGTLIAMPEPDPEAPGDLRPMPRSPALLLLETTGGTVALAPGEVRRIAVEGEPLAREVERSRAGSSLTLALEPQGTGDVPLSVLYVERGLTWAPSYAIDLSDPDQALLTAKAEVLDEAEDLEGATLQLVTGFPNLRFSQVTSPVAMQGDLEGFLAALRGSQQGDFDVMLGQNFLSNVAYRAEAAPAFPTTDAPADGLTVEDLFLYEVPDVTLKRGERGLYPLFSAQVPYEHVYEWEIPDTLEGSSQRRGREEPDVVDIWHSVRLVNESGVPWTTAPAMTMKDGHLLGQDVLSYTPVGARRTVRITRAVEIQGDRAEYEVTRDRNAGSFYGSTYDRVSVRGEIRVTNLKAEAVRLEITKHVQGEVAANPDEARVVAVAEGLRRVNPTTRLTWDLPLEPGEDRTLTYSYSLFVRP
jgi:hypothetical protein